MERVSVSGVTVVKGVLYVLSGKPLNPKSSAPPPLTVNKGILYLHSESRPQCRLWGLGAHWVTGL